MSDELDNGAIDIAAGDSLQPTSVVSARRDKNSYFKSLAILHLVVWGTFAAFVGATMGIVIRNEVIAKIVELDRLSAVAQTRQEWETLQNSISAYVWTGSMFTGGWPFALLYFGFLLLIFTAFWAVVHMTSIRILTLPRPVTAFEGFIVTTPRILYGLLPLYAGWIIIVGAIGLLLAPKISNPEAYTGSWRILDVLGSLPLALIVALVLCVAWIFLLPQATLSDSPKTAWLSSIRLIFKAPGFVIGRWFLYWFLAIAGIAIIVYVALWSTAIIPGNFYTLVFLFSLTFVACMGITTWVTAKMLDVWARVSDNEFENAKASGEMIFEPAPVVAVSFVAEKGEWDAGTEESESADIYVPTLDGGIRNLDEESKAGAWDDSNSEVDQLIKATNFEPTITESSQEHAEEPLTVVEPMVTASSSHNTIDSALVADAPLLEAETSALSEVSEDSALVGLQESAHDNGEPTMEAAPRAHRKAPPKLEARKHRNKAAGGKTPFAASNDDASPDLQEPEVSEPAVVAAPAEPQGEVSPQSQVLVESLDVDGGLSPTPLDSDDAEESAAPEIVPTKESTAEEGSVEMAKTKQNVSSLLHRKKPPKLPKKR